MIGHAAPEPDVERRLAAVPLSQRSRGQPSAATGGRIKWQIMDYPLMVMFETLV
jgi:hypothetical protein